MPDRYIAVATIVTVLMGGVTALCSQPKRKRGPSDEPVGRLTKQTYISPIDGASIDYALWLPPQYGRRTDWPLIIFLHGSAEGEHWRAPTRPAASVPVRGVLSDLPFVVAFPLMRGSWSISGMAERDVLDTLDEVLAKFSVDENRVHLVGLSLGSFAGWRIASRYPDRFASLTMFCGGGEPELAMNLRHVPIRVYHGRQDPGVPVKLSRDMVNALRKVDAAVDYTEFSQGKHDIWGGPMSTNALYDWMANLRRPTTPRRISYRTDGLKYRGAYWAHVDALKDFNAPAWFDAFIPPGTNRVLMRTENVAQMTLDVPAALLNGRQPVFEIDGAERPAQRTESGWRITLHKQPPSMPSKQPGLTGPIQDAFCGPFVVTVATSTDPAVAEAWFTAAQAGMSWVRKMVVSDVKVIRANAVTDEMMQRANLVCFGDVDTHPILAKLKDRLPLHADAGRLYYKGKPLSPLLAAFVMIYPNPLAPDRYLLICSGDPPKVATLASLVLEPPYINQPPLEDLVIMSHEGKLFHFNEQAETQENDRPAMGERLPPRGTLLDSSWDLPKEALQRLLALPNAAE